MLIRARFAKLSPVRYISHLELMNALRRAFRRAEIPVAYSRGYNPHQLLLMGQPLPVGMTGRGEYFDLELIEGIPPTDFMARVNGKLPQGIKVLEVKEVPAQVKSLMAVVNVAVYLVKMKWADGQPEEKEMINTFMEEKEIKVLRHRRKKKDRLIDIRPLIHDLEITEPGLWRFTVSTGSEGNVRPREIIRALTNYFPEVRPVPLINVEREGLFVRINDRLYQPIDDKVVGS